MKRFHLLLTAFLLSINLPAQNKREFKSANKATTIADKLTGTWKLIEFADFDSAASTWTYSYGRKPQGYFTYTQNGIVNLNIAAEKPLKISRDSAATCSVNLLNWLDSNSVGYFGTYTIDVENSVLIHHVQGGSIPWYIDSDQQRPFTFKGDTLIIGDNKTWKRVLIKVN